MRTNDLISLYRRSPLQVRAFIRGRLLLSDLDRVEELVPRTGTIVELGCGHGLFANQLALGSAGRHVIGIDLDPVKIEQARASIGGRANIEFRAGDALDMPLPECDAIAIVDVMYLLPEVDQLRILKSCRKALRPGGVLVWKAQDRRPRWKFAVTWLQETVMTSAGFTRGKRGRLCFLSRRQALAALERAGFRPNVVEAPTWRPYTDVIYTGR